MVKIMACGSMTPEDIELLSMSGIDAIGLITEVRQELACNLPGQTARELQNHIPPGILSVLILTKDDPDEIMRLVNQVKPDVVQLHGNVSSRDISLLKENLPVRITRALLVDENKSDRAELLYRQAREYLGAGADALLLDSSHEGKYGSTGRTVPVELARQLRDAILPHPLILAGGLNRDNIVPTLAAVQPYAVDVFTGITDKARLSPSKVDEFVKLVRSTSRQGDDRQ